MMTWIDIACIVFVCVTANHLGLIKAIESVTECELPIVNCVKCFTFWSVLTYSTFTLHDVVAVLAVSFFASYTAIWLELLEGFIDTLYMKLYEKIYSDPAHDTLAAADFDADSECPVS